MEDDFRTAPNQVPPNQQASTALQITPVDILGTSKCEVEPMKQEMIKMQKLLQQMEVPDASQLQPPLPSEVQDEMRKLQGFDVNDLSDMVLEKKDTPLMKGCRDGDAAHVVALIALGARVDVATDGGWTALMIAASLGHELCARALIKATANLEKQTANGLTALMLSTQNSYDHVTLALIKGGAYIEKPDDNGWTLLMSFVVKGHEPCTLALLEAKADLEKQTALGSTALMLAAQTGHEQVCAAVTRQEIEQ